MTSWNSNLFEFEWEGVGVGCLFEAWCLLTFSAFIMSAYLRWVLIRGCELILINRVVKTLSVGAGLTRL